MKRFKEWCLEATSLAGQIIITHEKSVEKTVKKTIYGDFPSIKIDAYFGEESVGDLYLGVDRVWPKVEMP